MYGTVKDCHLLFNLRFMRLLGIIPARFGSMRFPGKPLVKIGDKAMVERVYEQASHSTFLNKVIVATDHQDIYDYCVSHGLNVEMTSIHHMSGTERCAEVAQRHDEYDIVLNIHCDEPFLITDQIDIICRVFIDQTDSVDIVTLAKNIKDDLTLMDPDEVKVVFGTNMEAIYFSRLPIPFFRAADQQEWLLRHPYYKHIDLTGFRREILVEVASLNESYLETAEEIEALRWIENDYRIKIALTDIDSLEINSPEDLQKLVL